MNKTYNIAIVGATGAVGNCMREILESRAFPVNQLRLLASQKSHEKKLRFNGTEIPVEELRGDSFGGIDIALFSAGAERSKVFVPEAVRSGAIVIDNTSFFRMDPTVPLVVPEVNAEKIREHQGILANPNCSTIQMVTVLNPIHQRARIKRVVVSTYQSVSGAGQMAINELEDEVRAFAQGKQSQLKKFLHPIAFNLIPHIDIFLEDGSTKEEWKMIHETKKIMGDDSIRLTATCVRVPVFYAHSESVVLETEKKLTRGEAIDLLSRAPGVEVMDDPAKNRYPMPIEIAGRDKTYVGRIREDPSVPNGLSLWIVADNLRVGAALNAVKIAEELIRLLEE